MMCCVPALKTTKPNLLPGFALWFESQSARRGPMLLVLILHKKINFWQTRNFAFEIAFQRNPVYTNNFKFTKIRIIISS